MKSTLTTMLLSLTGITVVAGAVLATVNTLTQEPIAEAAAKGRLDALKELLPEFDNDISSAAVDGLDGTTVYPATYGGQPVGAAVSTWSDAGFGGHFEIIVGFTSTGAVGGYRVLSHAETPGLGAKMDCWFAAGGPGDITGTTAPVAVRADGGDVDAITGATITSRAFAEAVNRARSALNAFNEK